MRERQIMSLLEPTGNVRRNEFIQIGIPLPSGQFNNAGDIQLLTELNSLLPSVRTPTVFWPNGSIKWCLLGFFISLDSHQKINIYLKQSEHESQPDDHQQLVLVNTDSIEVKTKNYCFYLNKEIFTLFDRITYDNLTIAEKGFCRLVNNDHESLTAVIKEIHHQTSYSEKSPLYSKIIMMGQFQNSSGAIALNYETTLDFFYDSDLVKCAFTLHNPKRAIHPSGIWDLGDINSLLIKDFSLGFEIIDTTDVQWKVEPGHDWKNLKSHKLDIYQESSGGENWDSPNHKNKDGRVPMQQKGYSCQYNQKTVKGNRANPMISIGRKTGRINISVEKFWQTFPKSIGISENKVELGFFPQQYPDNIELQPGEKKTHCFYLDFSGQLDPVGRMDAPIVTCLNTDWINQCKVFPYLISNAEDDPIEQIIKGGLSSKDNFFAKRETIDEYGWRNFGDLYADHEADLHKGEGIFVSHYNNQYDPVYGFLHQFLLTGENQWFELADDLAKHITDIDIYHTDKDKDEYNGGAFWHTDHYLDAVTSSHRSYSKHHNYIYDGHAGGGGPGGQHCYTTGLLYHYLLTGSEASKLAVFQLCDWVTHVYDGSGTFFDLLTAIKNTSRVDLKNILTGKYPLDRGTGYYINALLDKFFLTREKSVLHQVEYVIRHTVHPLDNIDAHDLGDVEKKWFYTVFLQYLCRYLQTKEELSELDDDFYYARDTLLHYADWMVINEYPYLEKPEILEFPNHTWTAQDIRKVNILFFAAHYSSQQQNEYLLKATQLQRYIVKKLSVEPTRNYTRILSILMQNHIPQAAFNKSIAKYEFKPVGHYEPIKPPSKSSTARILLAEFFQVVRHFSIKNEIKWLDKRTQLITKYFGNH